MAPERLQGKLGGDMESFKKADMWSIGVLLHILIQESPPFEGNTCEALY